MKEQQEQEYGTSNSNSNSNASSNAYDEFIIFHTQPAPPSSSPSSPPSVSHFLSELDVLPAAPAAPPAACASDSIKNPDDKGNADADASPNASASSSASAGASASSLKKKPRRKVKLQLRQPRESIDLMRLLQVSVVSQVAVSVCSFSKSTCTTTISCLPFFSFSMFIVCNPLLFPFAYHYPCRPLTAAPTYKKEIWMLGAGSVRASGYRYSSVCVCV